MYITDEEIKKKVEKLYKIPEGNSMVLISKIIAQPCFVAGAIWMRGKMCDNNKDKHKKY